MLAGAVLVLLVVAGTLLQARILVSQAADPDYLLSHIDVPLSLPASTMVPALRPLVPLPTPTPEPQHVVRVQIPRLHIDRAVVPLDLKAGPQGTLEWNVEPLFATRNRPDLVGHVSGSALPGEMGNVVLTGHNYNRGRYNWRGVFVDLKKMRAGDQVILTTEDGRLRKYRVQSTTEVSLRRRDETTLARHAALLGPTEHEQLTLVTCGGANIWPFPSRVYVAALPDSAPP